MSKMSKFSIIRLFFYKISWKVKHFLKFQNHKFFKKKVFQDFWTSTIFIKKNVSFKICKTQIFFKKQLFYKICKMQKCGKRRCKKTYKLYLELLQKCIFRFFFVVHSKQRKCTFHFFFILESSEKSKMFSKLYFEWWKTVHSTFSSFWILYGQKMRKHTQNISAEPPARPV